MFNSDLSQLTPTQMEKRRADFCAELGGDPVAQKLSNALSREGVTSVPELKNMAESLGAREFHLRMKDIRGFGQKMTERVLQILKKDGYDDGAVRIEDLPIFPALPLGLTSRLTQSLEAARSAKSSDEALQGSDAPGLTYGDLRALERMLCGDLNERWRDGNARRI